MLLGVGQSGPPQRLSWRKHDATWIHQLAPSAELLGAGDVDASGEAGVVLDFGRAAGATEP